MKILILGGTGLIGHKLWIELLSRFKDIFTIIHGDKNKFIKFGLYNNDNVIDNVDIINFQKVESIVNSIQPDVILNCIGITKRKAEINNLFLAISVNSLFPHKLARWAKINNKRIIHFSTDCVFDGKIGNYTEESLTTAEDVYGRTKALGELRYNHTLTIRSSFIGRELFTSTELLEWFLSQKGKTIKGFTKALYSGVSTTFMSKVVCEIIENHPRLSGLYQLAIDHPVSKYELLCLARDAFQVDVNIIPDDTFETYPTLNGTKLRNELKLSVPSWKDMIHDLTGEKFYLK